MQYYSLHILDDWYVKQRTHRTNPLLQPEALRRLAWAVFYLDAFSDAGRYSFHTLSSQYYRIQLPCDETSFLRGLETKTPRLQFQDWPNMDRIPQSSSSLHEENEVGMLAHLIQTVAMRRRICHYVSTMKFSAEPPPKLLLDLETLGHELNRIVVGLPSSLAYSKDNLFACSGQQTTFITLHVLRHNCFMLLNKAKLLLTERLPSLEDSLQHRKDRIKHALPVARIVDDALHLGISCEGNVGTQAYMALESTLASFPIAKADHIPSSPLGTSEDFCRRPFLRP